MLTTFNEVDLSEVLGLRSRYKDVFEKQYGARLGFMGFFIKAAIAPIAHHHYFFSLRRAAGRPAHYFFITIF